MSPVVSVVIPTINSLKYLQATVRTVLRQSMGDLELVVVDEASTDGTAEWLDAHEDPRVRVVHHKRPMGACYSRNDGMDACTADIIAFCDHDDLWAPTKLERQLEAMERTGAGWSAVTSYSFDPAKRIVEVQRVPADGDISVVQLQRQVVPGGASSVIATTATLERAGRWDPAIVSIGDNDYWTRLALAGPFVGVDEPLMAYRETVTGMSARLWPVPDLDVVDRRYSAERAERGVSYDMREIMWWAYRSYARTPERVLMMRLAWEMVRRRFEPPTMLVRAAGAVALSGFYKRRQEQRLTERLAADPVAVPEWLQQLFDENLAGMD